MEAFLRVLVLGAAGMLGHKLWQICCERFDTWVTARAEYRSVAGYDLFDPQHFISGVDVTNRDSMLRVLGTVQPDAVVNCVGIIKQLPAAKDPIVSLTINSLFPHRLASLCQVGGIRLIHISTDCVFAGRKGMYREDDVSDAEDLYGRTKYLGEVSAPHCLTLRTSIIGRELRTGNGLVEWLLSNQGGSVRGFCKAIYSGLTTQTLARVIAETLEQHEQLTGLYHVSSRAIDKYTLLCLIRDEFGVKVDIAPDPSVQIDRSLDGSRFSSTTGFQAPAWPEMIRDMATDPTPYDHWRSRHAS
jgi:dTDP-4-dehydrorhamnose reductase